MIVNTVNDPKLGALFTVFRDLFQSFYNQVPTFLNELATTTTTTSTVLRFPWMGRVMPVREWVGDRAENSNALKFLDVVPKLYELTEGLSKSDFDDDQYGFFTSHIIPQMAMQAAKWPDYALIKYIQDNPVWSDGSQFFDTDHPINVDRPEIVGFDNNNYYANDYGSMPLTLENFRVVRANMMNLVGEDGKSLEIVPNLLIVPPSLEAEANHICKSEYIAPGVMAGETSQVGMVNNPLKGLAVPKVIQPLGSAPTTWYLADTTKPIKPWGWCLREPWTMAQRTSPTDPIVFDKNKYLFGGRGRGAAFGAFPFLVSRATA
jgi:phage major head subunit gpT-like protein